MRSRLSVIVLSSLMLLASFSALAKDKTLSWSDASGADSLEISGWLAMDFEAFPRVETGYDKSWHLGPDMRVARLRADFQLNRIWGGRLDLELASLDPVKMDMWFEARFWSWLKVRAGHFKTPFGRSQLLSLPDRSLLEAPLVAGNPKDFRDTGLMLHGGFLDKRLEYGLALVTGSRDLTVDVNEKPDFVGRLSIRPLRGLGPWLEGLGLGGSFSWGEGPRRRGFRGRSMAGWTFVVPPGIRGEQLRWGAEFEWLAPVLSFRAEYQWQRQARDGVEDSQRVGGSMVSVGDLEPWKIEGFYAELAAQLWGERDASGPVTGIELSARFESLDFSDGTRMLSTPSGDEDHAPLPDSWVEGLTLGLNGYLDNGLRLSAVYQGLRFGRRELAPDYDADILPAQNPSEAGHWVHHFFLRAQFVY
ncbi:MAG: hypothetical protein JRF33_07085 [Deltaproteobacteria bacterium]|nr:hypothetical protein [Deltaproteobacteria bacterium]